MPELHSAKMWDILSVPAQFSIAPSGSLSVAALLHLDLHTVLEIDTHFIFEFSKTSPMRQVPVDFASRSILPFQTAALLHDRASSALQDGNKSVIHPLFPSDPLPLWVLSYWVLMSYALENQCDWHTSHNWVLDRLDVVPAGGAELGIIDWVLDVLGSLPWDAPLKGFGAETNLRTTGLRPLLASCPIDGRVLDTLIASVVHCMQASDDGDLRLVSIEPLTFADILRLGEERWKNYKTDKAFSHLRVLGSALHEGTLQRVLFPINIDNVHWAAIEVNTINRSISYADSLNWSPPTHIIQ